ncbi:hypothetical protein AVEN_153791-1 [Araneus ventricosus]|uniref:Uncharacterized protein n=1 Tax=Araneus ventricosus TaxID=182803 RepID=A0A4Y2PIL5_ARAVE|nr:hypothetical protein AVEN_101744-1 [Araneus ventricosus]GBN51067.1 hypothetical protein AVEN_153791-1 [Araneus ventricosus]
MHQSAEEIQVGAARDTALASVKVRSLRNCEATLRKTKATFPPIESGGGLSCIGGSPLAQCQLPVAILFSSLRPQDGLRSLDLFLLRLFLVRRYLVMVSLSRCRRKLICFNKHPFLLSRMRSIQRESIVIVNKFELEILTNLHALDLPESEKRNFEIMSVCEHDNSKNIRAKGMKFGMWSLHIICRFLSNFGQNPSKGSLSVCMFEVMRTL